MRYLALATDYDGTLAHDGRVDEETIDALKRLRNSGRYLLLVTGRELDDLNRVFPHGALFHRIIAENGAVIFDPKENRVTKLNGNKPPEEFIHELRKRAVQPLSVGQVIVATWHPNEKSVLDVIRDLGLELQVIFNKGAVMILPSGVNKATGLALALQELRLSPHNVAAIGDAENDHAFLKVAEFSAAVSNALDSLKQNVDLVTQGDHGKGVCELIELIVDSDLSGFVHRLERQNIAIGTLSKDREVTLPPYGTSIMIAGTSGGGKTTLASVFLERFLGNGYQFCIVDPEGDYQELSEVIAVGSTKQAPPVSEIKKILEKPEANCAVNLLAIPILDRPSFCEKLFAEIHSLRAHYGRPHWLIVDELHHVLPEERNESGMDIPLPLNEVLMITVHPEHVSRPVLKQVEVLLVIGSSPDRTILNFCETTGIAAPPNLPTNDLEPGTAILWRINSKETPFQFKTHSSQLKRLRHIRKYAEGDLGSERSFYFRGPKNQLNLRAQNLNMFIHMAEGVDDETWFHHLRQNEYSSWIRTNIKDEELAEQVEQIERQNLSAKDSRNKIKEAIEQRYTAPA